MNTLKYPPLRSCSLREEFIKLMLVLKHNWQYEKIVTSDVDPQNFLVQKISPERKVLRIVDNIGTPVLIPLAFYFDYFADRRFIRYWRRFVEDLAREHPQIVTDAVLKELL